ncbi:hypothetical protein [Maribacter sp. 2210JD10-5]|uniref:hypothetical protein n=1 Tax=Maribacter sp. 2210JD10-5 TaxID=3386272 RepID=UPI0039BD2A98
MKLITAPYKFKIDFVLKTKEYKVEYPFEEIRKISVRVYILHFDEIMYYINLGKEKISENSLRRNSNTLDRYKNG